jgi:hypothetical protein
VFANSIFGFLFVFANSKSIFVFWDFIDVENINDRNGVGKLFLMIHPSTTLSRVGILARSSSTSNPTTTSLRG